MLIGVAAFFWLVCVVWASFRQCRPLAGTSRWRATPPDQNSAATVMNSWRGALAWIAYRVPVGSVGANELSWPA